jgi:hypothetical protein
MTRFFGQRWDAPIVNDARQVPNLLGEPCLLCDHTSKPDDQGFIRPHVFEDGNVGFMPVHRGCEMATAIGHLFGLCSCTGSDDIYERGRELVRRDDTGQLKPVDPGRTA